MDIRSRFDHFPVRSDSLQHFSQKDNRYYRVDDTERDTAKSLSTSSVRSISEARSVTQDMTARETWPTGNEEHSLQATGVIQFDAELSEHLNLIEQLNSGRNISPTRRTDLDELRSPDSTLSSECSTAEIESTINDMLQIPLSLASLRFSNLNGRPLGVEIAINAYWRGECSTGAPDGRFMPAKLRMSLSSVPEEQAEAEPGEIKDAVELSDAWTSSNILSGMDKISCEYFDPKPRYPIEPLLSASKQKSWEVSTSLAAELRSMAGSIHHVGSISPPIYPPPNKPLPALPIASQEDHSQEHSHNGAFEGIPSREGLSKQHDNVVHTCRFDLPHELNDSQITLPKGRLLQSTLDTSHFALAPGNVDPADIDKHPLFRKRQHDRLPPLRVSFSPDRRGSSLSSPILQHRKFLSGCSDSSMVSPSRPHSGAPSSYLRSLAGSPPPPSESASDPGPVRLDSLHLSDFHSRASLDDSSRDSPSLPELFWFDDAPDKTAAQMYAEEIEGLHGLSRQVSLTDRAALWPLLYSEHILGSEESQTNLRIRDVRYPMKTKRSALKRLSMIQRQSMESASVISTDGANEIAVHSPPSSFSGRMTRHDFGRSAVSLMDKEPSELAHGVIHEPRFKTLRTRAQSIEKVRTRIKPNRLPAADM